MLSGIRNLIFFDPVLQKYSAPKIKQMIRILDQNKEFQSFFSFSPPSFSFYFNFSPPWMAFSLIKSPPSTAFYIARPPFSFAIFFISLPVSIAFYFTKLLPWTTFSFNFFPFQLNFVTIFSFCSEILQFASRESQQLTSFSFAELKVSLTEFNISDATCLDFDAISDLENKGEVEFLLPWPIPSNQQFIRLYILYICIVTSNSSSLMFEIYYQLDEQWSAFVSQRAIVFFSQATSWVRLVTLSHKLKQNTVMSTTKSTSIQETQIQPCLCSSWAREPVLMDILLPLIMNLLIMSIRSTQIQIAQVCIGKSQIKQVILTLVRLQHRAGAIIVQNSWKLGQFLFGNDCHCLAFLLNFITIKFEYITFIVLGDEPGGRYMKRPFGGLRVIVTTHIFHMIELLLIIAVPFAIGPNCWFGLTYSIDHLLILHRNPSLQFVTMRVLTPKRSLHIIITRIIPRSRNLCPLALRNINQSINEMFVINLSVVHFQVRFHFFTGTVGRVINCMTVLLIELVIDGRSCAADVLVVAGLVLKVQELLGLFY